MGGIRVGRDFTFHTSQAPEPVRPLTAKKLHARFASEPHQAPPGSDKKELSFGAGRDTKGREEAAAQDPQRPQPAKTPPTADDRSRRIDGMLARRAAQMKDRDKGCSR